MPTNTYTPLANITLSSSASSVTFSSISQAYRDLILVTTWADNGSYVSAFARYNGDSGSNYSAVWMSGNGSSTSSGTDSSITSARLFAAAYAAPSGALQQGTVTFMDYSATDKHKTTLSRYDYAGGEVSALATRWANTSAITSIALTLGGGSTFSAGSTFSLFGVAA